MKKITLMAMAFFLLLPLTVKADWVKEVTNKSELQAALNAFENVEGCVDKIIVKGDEGTLINLGNYTMACDPIVGGKLIVTSEQTDINKVPQIMFGFNFTDTGESPKFSMEWSNLGLQYRSGATASSGQIFYSNIKKCAFDSIIIRNCDVNNIARCLYRTVPDFADEEQTIRNTYPINYFEMSGCKVHNLCTQSGNPWGVIYFGQCTKEIVIDNNIWYDIPYAKALIYYGYIDSTGEEPYVSFNNNTVIWGSGDLQNKKPVFDAGGFLGELTTYSVKNNIFMNPEGGEYIQNEYNDSAIIVRATGGLHEVYNNVIRGFQPYEAGITDGLDIAEDGTMTPDDAGLFWGDFYNADGGDFRLLKSHPLYTMGVDGEPIGSTQMYVDEFPVECKVNITVDGPAYASYTITPNKAKYFKDDVVTIKATAHNNYYRTFATFDGWSDGETLPERQIKLTEDVNLTAKFTEVAKVLSAFDFTVNAGTRMSSYDADIYYGMGEGNDAYRAQVYEMMCDTTNQYLGMASYEYVSSLSDIATRQFETRAGKFAEDDVEEQMNIISRRTPWQIKDGVDTLNYENYDGWQRDHAIFKFNTKGAKGLNFSCYVGTDNNASKYQQIYWSLDGENWEMINEVELEAWYWSELAADLPACCEDKDSVFIKVIGDPTRGSVRINGEKGETVQSEEDYHKQEGFEYIANVLMSYTELTPATGLRGDADEDGAVTVSDITTIAAFILGNNPSPFNMANADVDGDGEITVSDITGAAGIILGK